MRVLFASAEVYPLVKTGGLADVSAALPHALREIGVDVQIIVPAYPSVLSSAADKMIVAELSEDGVYPTRLIRARMPDSGLPIWLVDSPIHFDRAGTPYRNEQGDDWPDNAVRFGWFSRVAAKLAVGELVPGWCADVVHANDWHTGLLPVLLRDQRPATVFTIHNLAYQGRFPRSVLQELGLSPSLFALDGIEFYGDISFLKAGIQFADAITTVSPSYAREIITPEFGCGLDGLLRYRFKQLRGILNGVDYNVWNPAIDSYLASPFDLEDLSGKSLCKADLQRELKLDVEPDVPLIVWLSRITDQKMADVVAYTLHRIFDRDVQLAILGDGDAALEEKFQEAVEHYPGQLAVRIGYQEAQAHRYLGGADLLLHPARFEPCGLTPLYAMRYGVLPIVRHVGGLSDTIVDATEWTVPGGTASGFAFRESTADGMLDCLDRALAYYGDRDRWEGLQRRAMSREFGWTASAQRYLALYRTVAPKVADIEPVRCETPVVLMTGATREVTSAPAVANRRTKRWFSHAGPSIVRTA